MKRNTVFTATLQAAKTHRWLSLGTALCALSSVAVSLLPPLVLGHLIDRLTVGLPFPFYLALVYFGSLVLEGVLTAAQETTLELFGQKMTHALRTEMSKKLTHLPAATLAAQEPGAVAARFNGDVDAVEALFTSGVISMTADCCRIVSIFAVILRKNPGLALVLLVVLPLLAVFTRYVQKRMLSAQLENRKAVAAISAQVPEALHNIRTIHLLGLENYMERRYDKCIGQSYAAVEKTNFFDAVYSPVVLTLDAVVVGIVMLLSVTGNPGITSLFGMSVANSGASSVKGRNIAEFRGRSGPLARAAARRRRHPVSVPSRSRLGAPDFFGRPDRGSSRYGPGNSSPFGATYGAITGRRRHFFLFGVPRYGRDFAGRLETGHARRDRASSICSA